MLQVSGLGRQGFPKLHPAVPKLNSCPEEVVRRGNPRPWYEYCRL